MRKRISLVAIIGLLAVAVYGQGLRQSVCIVAPEYEKADKELFADYGLYMARAEMREAARTLTAYMSEDLYGSGVVVARGERKYVLTNLHVVGYAKKATVTFQLHDKTLRYEHCEVIGIGSSVDIAAILLPKECEMVSLSIFDGEIDEGMSIVAAGFPSLAGKPSWQMTRGDISNARVDVEEQAMRIIQHTASIDPGSSGGPLLYKKEDGKYAILGINTWKAFNREGVGLAIGKEDVEAFLLTLGNSEADESRDFSPARALSGEEWLYVFRHLPETCQKQVKDMDWRLPLDPVLRTIALRDSIVSRNAKEAKRYNPSASHIVKDLSRKKHVRLFYDNYIGVNQQVGGQIGFSWLGFIEQGVQISALITDVMTEDPDYGTELGYKTRVGAMFGLYIGGQIPIAVGKYMLVPRITQSACGGPMKTGNIYGGFAILTDTRAGIDWRMPFSSCDLILGVHYDMNWLWSNDKMNMAPYKAQKDRETLNQYLQHGVGITLGVGW